MIKEQASEVRKEYRSSLQTGRVVIQKRSIRSQSLLIPAKTSINR